jgi:hypothetical protein
VNVAADRVLEDAVDQVFVFMAHGGISRLFGMGRILEAPSSVDGVRD